MEKCTVNKEFLSPDSDTIRTLNRRHFLKLQLQGALWLSAAASGVFIPERTIAEPQPDITVVEGKPGPAARAAVEGLGGMKRFVKPGQSVVIKPNMSFPKGQDRASNTDTGVVQETAAMCWEAGASRVRILDNVLGTETYCIADIKSACSTIKPDMVHNIADGELFEPVKLSDSWGGFNKTDVMKDVLSADVLIAVPKAKSHHSTGVSLSMKGMMGLIYDRWIMHISGLDQSIVTLAKVLKPSLVIVDASRVLSTNGPRGPGEIIPENKIIASTDMVAADAITVKLCTWYGRKMEPRQVKHIRLAHDQGLGRMDIENLYVKTYQV